AISFAWRVISRCCWAGVIVFIPVAVVGGMPADAAACAAASVAAARAAARRAVIRSYALSRSIVAPYFAWNGLVAIRPWNWRASIGAISESGASSRVAASGVGTPFGDRTVT